MPSDSRAESSDDDLIKVTQRSQSNGPIGARDTSLFSYLGFKQWGFERISGCDGLVTFAEVGFHWAALDCPQPSWAITDASLPASILDPAQEILQELSHPCGLLLVCG